MKTLLHTAVLLLACTKLVAQATPPPLTKTAKAIVIKSFEKQVSDNYIFADTAKRMAAYVDKQFKAGAYDTINDRKNFALALTNDVHSVYGDKHFSVRYMPQMAEGLGKSNAPDDKAEQQRQLLRGRSINFGFAKAEILKDNIGYIKLDGFWGVDKESMQTVKAAFAFVANAKALIFDLRNNHGGDPAMVQYICGFLFKEKTHLNDLYERRINKMNTFYTTPDTAFQNLYTVPVYVLTSKICFSAGEEFTYDLQTQKRATVIGEVTGGGAHPIDFFNLGEGFVTAIPIARAINPITKTNWEGAGVQPDVPVAADKALDTAVTMIKH